VAGGHIDASQANPWDARWYIRRNILLRAVEDIWDRDFLKCRLLKHLAFIQSPHVTDASVIEHNRNSAITILEQLFDLTTCTERSADKDELSVAKQARANWSRQFGDPGNPDVAKKIDDTAELLRRRRELSRKAL